MTLGEPDIGAFRLSRRDTMLELQACSERGESRRPLRLRRRLRIGPGPGRAGGSSNGQALALPQVVMARPAGLEPTTFRSAT